MAVATRPKVWIAAPPKHAQFAKYAGDVFVCLVGLTSPFAFHFVGDVPIGEALLICALPVLVILGGRRALKPQLRPVYVLMTLWLLGLVIADAYNHTNITDRMRGSALIIFFGLDLLGMSILLGQNERRKLLYFVGSTIGALAQVKLQPSPAVVDYPWKFGYAWGTMQAVLLISCYFYARGKQFLASLCLVAIILVNLLLNFRSPVLYLLITLVLIFPVIPERIGSLQILPAGKVARTAVMMILALSAGQVADFLIEFVTQAGYISEEARVKNEAQIKGGNLLLGGRPEFMIGLRAALDSPIIGHGSWAKDLKYFEMLTDAMIESGALAYTPDFEEDTDGLIPGHSHIITEWVWAGIAAPIFWLYILAMIFRATVRVTILKPALAPLYTFIMIATVWSILFSPFAFDRRMSEAVLIVIMADLLEKKVMLASPSWQRMGAVNPRRSLGQGNASATPIR